MQREGQDRGSGVSDIEIEIAGLLDAMREANVRVRDGAEAGLARLAALISRHNRAINLISRRDIGRLVSYHFFDSASLLPLILPERKIRVLDVGGSNGLPGLVLASICSEVEVTIRDGRAKRAAFLEEACAVAGPGNRFEVGRVDDKEFVVRNGESFDLIVARAVAGLRLLLKWCLPLLRPGGVVAAYKGSRCTSEVAAARKSFFSSGGIVLAVAGSPFGERYNPLRKFAIAVKSD